MASSKIHRFTEGNVYKLSLTTLVSVGRGRKVGHFLKESNGEGTQSPPMVLVVMVQPYRGGNQLFVIC